MSPGRRTGAGRMSGFRAIAVAIGFLRDKMSTFFTVVFPLMFLVLFGGVFSYDSSPKIDMIQVGDLPS
jgi:ABC-2 type transport system permease protein